MEVVEALLDASRRLVGLGPSSEGAALLDSWLWNFEQRSR